MLPSRLPIQISRDASFTAIFMADYDKGIVRQLEGTSINMKKGIATAAISTETALRRVRASRTMGSRAALDSR